MRRPKSPLRTPFVVTVASAMVACGGGVAGGDPTIATNPPPAQNDHVVTTPEHRADCTDVKEDTACRTGDTCGELCTGDPAFKCIDGRWQGYGAGCNPPAQSCPASAPASGAPCNGMEGMTCQYATSTDCPPETATCDGTTEKWVIGVSTCNPPVVDGGSD